MNFMQRILWKVVLLTAILPLSAFSKERLPRGVFDLGGLIEAKEVASSEGKLLALVIGNLKPG